MRSTTWPEWPASAGSRIVTLHELADRLRNDAADGRIIVGLDGVDGVHKTGFGELLAQALSAEVVSLDDYLRDPQQRYVSAICLERLRDAVARVRSRLVIVEGLCLLEVAARCGFEIDQHVYVVKIDNVYEHWNDEAIGHPAEPAALLKERYLCDANVLATELVSDPGWRGELIDYHCQQQPFERAQSILVYRPHQVDDVLSTPQL